MIAKILIVEDEPAVRELIAYNLQQAGYDTVHAEDAEKAMAVIDAALPNLILLDWMLPKMSGVEFARALRRQERTRSIPIIMLTARIQEADKVSGLDVADDYITKPFSPRELIARINAVLRRLTPEASDEVVELDGLKLEPAQHRVMSGDKKVELGPTEYRLLHFLMTHTERVYSRSQLLDRVWGDHVFVEERTIDVHIRRLRKALEAVGKDEWIQTVRGAGYRFSVVIPLVDDANPNI
ncbi:phosphate regulon transcriptional regulatory protein PhoB [Nitrosomonas sp. JL21]|uniref:phosphate regulon transcriptional regulator PhoB n=1 Tax=Nitrosomonas sp. JL21 TaxID=153949 RepID=UPI00136F4D81|nr:phosphate regulon transcriptional regulator PhoB [Nitrosomonas sp. JL21]MBL8497825.1 phosphate regulon transcriptional regulator PhoB [Nitrosomonas sp.]MCC7092404.1 phosphate regulon transcriptional regulator PhoB [Nitrosomonas sp.]MXS76771.1 phosphate regulon transcriptional regulatory protein PhoB [Nitrosomonas sp. JL21]